MKHVLVLVATLVSTPTLANPTQRVSHRAVLENITVTPDNGGFNPSFSATTISAHIMVGANGCAAQGLTARLKVSQKPDGTQYVYGLVSGYQPRDLACPYNFDPVYADVSTTLRGRVGFEKKTFLLHAFERNLTVSLSRLVQCSPSVACTMEYNPQMCEYQGVRFQGSNPCMSAVKAQTFACVKGLAFNFNDMPCSNVDTMN